MADDNTGNDDLDYQLSTTTFVKDIPLVEQLRKQFLRSGALRTLKQERSRRHLRTDR